MVAAAVRLVTHDDLTRVDRLCYRARIADQHAYRVRAPWRTNPSVIEEALAIYEGLPKDDVPPFVGFRREIGIAWCVWRLGTPDLAMVHAQRAYDHAGDGGFVRLRIMALNLMAWITDERADGPLRGRAAALARDLEDVDLERRSSAHRLGTATPSTP